MAERSTAEDQLSRILDLLPRAARDGGVRLSELAATLGTEQRSVLRDLQEVYTRAFYHPAGSGEDVQILIEAEQVEVWTTGEFRRPVRLNAREALALGLGLRVLAADSPAPARAELVTLAERLEERLSSESPEAILPHIAVDSGAADPEGIRSLLTAAARERRRCRISYLKPAATEPEVREVDPYVLLVADGKWYAVGHCRRSDDVRVFRVDRVVEAAPLEETFEVPDGFDAGMYVSDGRVYRAEDDVEVTVRYSARIARWIEEQGPVDRLEDGSVTVRYRVADPQWVVRHVLQHAPDAEVLGPPEVRELVVTGLKRILG
jgi:proteasome accessory factor C